MLVVWSDNLDNIIDLCREFEEKLIKLVWRSRNLLLAQSPPTDSSLSSTTSSNVNLNEKQAGTTTDVVVVPDRDKPAPRKTRRAWSWKPSPPADRKKSEARAEEASEKGAVGKNPRPIRLFASVYGGLGVALSICQFSVLFLSPSPSLLFQSVFIGTSINLLLQEFKLDGNYIRFALVVTTPFWVCVSLVSLCLSLWGGDDVFSLFF